jgi:hypothetical protein
MIHGLVALIVNEANWLPVSMAVALLSASVLLYRHAGLPGRRRAAAAMNVYFGVVIATMAFGHLAAVTARLVSGTLRASPPALYAIGVALAVPAGWLVSHGWRLATTGDDGRRKTLVLNAWLAATLLALGLHNLPLALPAAFNAGYELHSRRMVGWGIVGAALAVTGTLFAASLVFMASGQSFEQFTGME